MAAAKAFFESAKMVTGITPDRVTTDGHNGHRRAIPTKLGTGVRHRNSQYLNTRWSKIIAASKILWSDSRVQLPMVGWRILSPLDELRSFSVPAPDQSTSLRRLPEVPLPSLHRNDFEAVGSCLKNLVLHRARNGMVSMTNGTGQLPILPRDLNFAKPSGRRGP